MVDEDGSLHVGAGVQGQVILLVLTARFSMAKWRDPSALRLQRLGPFRAGC